MSAMIRRRIVVGFLLAGTLAVAAACSAPSSSSLSPTAPTVASLSAVSGEGTSGPTGLCPDGTKPDPVTGQCVPPPPPPPPPPKGDEGCTPGYWKANVRKGGAEWALAGYAPSQAVGTVFVAGPFDSATLLQALEFGGGPGVAGATRILLRAAVAAVLNAASGGVAYPWSVSAIVAAVNNAIAGADRAAILALASQLDGFNNLGCPLDNSN